MSDEIDEEVEDHYKEHELHKEQPDSQCSSCWDVFHNHDCKQTPESSCEVCILFSNSRK